MADEAQKTLQEAINEAVATATAAVAEQFGVEYVMNNSWVLVGEWADADGGLWMTVRSSVGLTSWRARGMLGEAVADIDRERK